MIFPKSCPPPTLTSPAPPPWAEIIRTSVRGTEHRSPALAVRAVPYGDADLVVGLFTESLGLISALARRARGARRLHLEPMHTLEVALRERPGASLLSIRSASMQTPRTRLIASFERMQTAGTVLRWVRQAVPPRTPEPDVWNVLIHLLDALDEPELATSPSALLVVAGMGLLRALGYGLDLDRCVTCGRGCPAERSSHVDAARGGLVCRRCGGAGPVVSGAMRTRLKAAASGVPVLRADELPLGIALVESALLAHANVR
ncbi:MAG: DNA repair protein RecO [Myxococcota bacterium]